MNVTASLAYVILGRDGGDVPKFGWERLVLNVLCWIAPPLFGLEFAVQLYLLRVMDIIPRSVAESLSPMFSVPVTVETFLTGLLGCRFKASSGLGAQSSSSSSSTRFTCSNGPFTRHSLFHSLVPS
jgi:hypothetical protein